MHIEAQDTIISTRPSLPHTWEVMPRLECKEDAPQMSPQVLRSPFEERVSRSYTEGLMKSKEEGFRWGDVRWHDALLDSLYSYTETVPYRAKGVVGDPLPYRFRNDSVITSLILIVLFILLWITSRGGRYFIKHLHESMRESNVGRRVKTHFEIQSQLFIIFSTSLTLGLLTYVYAQEHMPLLLDTASPYAILFSSSGIFFLYFVGKLLLYALTNGIFFSRKVVYTWAEVYFLYLLFLCLGLFPLSLLAIYFDLSYAIVSWTMFSIVVIGKIYLYLKSKTIFMSTKFNFLHNILYLCALEIVPSLILWRLLLYSLQLLTAID